MGEDVFSMLGVTTVKHPNVRRLRPRIGPFPSAVKMSVAVVTAATPIVSLLVATPSANAAQGDRLYPAGCEVTPAITSSYGWGKTCWVGTSAGSYDNNSLNVLGIQYIDFDTGFNPSGLDCAYGQNASIATSDYQRAHALTPDGIVGTKTWTSYQNQLTFSGIEDTNFLYYNVGVDSLRFAKSVSIANAGSFYILEPMWWSGPAYVQMAANESDSFLSAFAHCSVI